MVQPTSQKQWKIACVYNLVWWSDRVRGGLKIANENYHHKQDGYQAIWDYEMRGAIRWGGYERGDDEKERSQQISNEFG